MLTEADAFRVGGLITVRLIGQLPTPCDEVKELVHYPANGIGSARIFLREAENPDWKICTAHRDWGEYGV
ncbi:hypothetical protein [Bacillus sp. ISL-7]|uniref:hypothetical protein n=1 Tax=Bacillus sp. ISL-7 TaxID=2819136 RepID=UPI001BE73CA0|nr:hypothetical protein [Bacillus sp. ISL-7]MBT2738353.1 hypothetical protein [Bacillus sp. ISL-7]